jgi:hypothetical protein
MPSDDARRTAWFALLQELLAVYQAAIPIARSISEHFELDHQTETNLGRLHVLIDAARLLDDKIRQTPRPASSPRDVSAASLLAEVASMIEQLIALCDQIERQAASRRNSLRPHLTENLRVKQAELAYARSGQRP